MYSVGGEHEIEANARSSPLPCELVLIEGSFKPLYLAARF
jgi:hypothetical protein